MTTLREAAQQALEALEYIHTETTSQEDVLIHEAITALRAALAEPQEPKCGAIIEVFGKDWRLEYLSLPVGRHKLYVQEYSYTAPQPRRRLTDEEIQDAVCNANLDWHRGRTPLDEDAPKRYETLLCRAIEDAIWSKT